MVVPKVIKTKTRYVYTYTRIFIYTRMWSFLVFKPVGVNGYKDMTFIPEHMLFRIKIYEFKICQFLKLRKHTVDKNSIC